MNGDTFPVYQPFWRGPRTPEQFRFQLPTGDQVVATRDESHCTTLHLNEVVLARIYPAFPASPSRFGLRSYPLELATVSTHGEHLSLVATIYLGLSSNHYRIRSQDGSRMCFWKKTAGWGAGNATLLVSPRVPSTFFPVAISATLISLLDD